TQLLQPLDHDHLQSNAMIRKAVIGCDCLLFEEGGALLPQSDCQCFHIRMVLIACLHEQHRTGSQCVCPLHVVPVLCVSFRFGKETRGCSTAHGMQLCFPALQTGLPFSWIRTDLTEVHR